MTNSMFTWASHQRVCARDRGKAAPVRLRRSLAPCRLGGRQAVGAHGHAPSESGARRISQFDRCVTARKRTRRDRASTLSSTLRVRKAWPKRVAKAFQTFLLFLSGGALQPGYAGVAAAGRPAGPPHPGDDSDGRSLEVEKRTLPLLASTKDRAKSIALFRHSFIISSSLRS